jgi:RNA polymerase sigma factor (TIGR02999 family)
MLETMSDVTRILSMIESGDQQASDELLPLVYDELRKLAAARMANERPDHTLQATALVHDAYVRLVGSSSGAEWKNRSHFFAAAAEAMRKILIDSARRRQTQKRGGDLEKVPLDDIALGTEVPLDDMLDFDEALSRLEGADPDAAQLVKLRVFAGLSVEEAAESLGVAARTAYRDWSFAQAWLYRELRDGSE